MARGNPRAPRVRGPSRFTGALREGPAVVVVVALGCGSVNAPAVWRRGAVLGSRRRSHLGRSLLWFAARFFFGHELTRARPRTSGGLPMLAADSAYLGLINPSRIASATAAPRVRTSSFRRIAERDARPFSPTRPTVQRSRLCAGRPRSLKTCKPGAVATRPVAECCLRLGSLVSSWAPPSCSSCPVGS